MVSFLHSVCVSLCSLDPAPNIPLTTQIKRDTSVGWGRVVKWLVIRRRRSPCLRASEPHRRKKLKERRRRGMRFLHGQCVDCVACCLSGHLSFCHVVALAIGLNLNAPTDRTWPPNAITCQMRKDGGTRSSRKSAKRSRRFRTVCLRIVETPFRAC